MEADRLRFHSPPRTEVRFSGFPGREATTTSSRTNLPDPVSPGVDYHDVRIVYTLANLLRGAAPREER